MHINCIKFLYASLGELQQYKVVLDHFLQLRKEVKKYVYEKLGFFGSRAMRQPCTGFLSED